MKINAIIKNIPPNEFLNIKFINNFSKSFFLFLMLFQNCYSYSSSRMDDFFDYSTHPKARSSDNLNPKKCINQGLVGSNFKTSFVFENIVVNQLIINTTLKTSYCTGENSLIVCQANGVYNANNVFSVVLSDSSGSFTSPTIIGKLISSATGSSSINFKIPTDMPVGHSYRIRLKASSPLTTSSDNGFNISITTIPAPTTILSQVICKGQSKVLSANCSQGAVKWYDSEIGGNIISNTTIAPAITTDYFAECQQGTTCVSARKVHTVIVSNFDNIVIPPSASSCLNSDLELAVITDDTDLTYSWTGPNGFTSTSQTPIIPNLTSAKVGVYTVLITNINNCTTNGTTSVTIGQSLQSLNVAGDVAVCFNGTINLTATTSVASGMTYLWSGPNSFTATGQSISRIAFTANNNLTTYHDGDYTVIASNAITGCTGTTSVSIAVGNPPNVPALSPTGTICEGTPYTLDWAIGGANFKNYTWSGPNGFTSSAIAVCDSNFICGHATATVPNFRAVNVGIYIIKATFKDNFNNSCMVSATKNVTLKYGPDISIASNSAVCLGDALLFAASYTSATSGISSYAWTGPNNFTSTLQNPVIYPTTLLNTGVYKLTAVGLNSCIGVATSYGKIVESVPPTIESTASVVLGNSISLTANGCNGTLFWYKTSDNQSVGMPVSPTVTTSYYAKCNNENCVSGKSLDISVSIKPPIAISVKTGNWEDATTWDILRVPLPIDSVIIRPNHFITINSLCTAKWLAWTGFGNLVFKSTASKLNLFGNPITPPPSITSNLTSVIEGKSVTFTATGTGTITWYKNGVSLNVSGISYTVSQPVKGDIYTAKASLEGILSVASNTITVLADPNPIIGSPPVLTSNPTNVTEGSSVTFIATATGAISWYKNGVILNTNVINFTVSQPVKGDIYTAKSTVNSTLSSASNAITVGANPNPASVSPPVISSNPTPVLEGVSVTFTATGQGTIIWYKNDVNINVNGTSYTVSQPVKGDVYTARAIVSNVFSAISNSITVEASTPPTGLTPPVLSSNPVNVIENVSVTFTASGTGVISWYKNGVSLNISGTNYTVSQPIKEDVYTAKRSVNNVISASSNAITVESATPVAVTPPVLDSSPVNVIENVSVTFTASGTGVISWYKNGVSLNISGTNYTESQPVKGDVYTIKRSVNNAISVASNSISVQASVSTIGVSIIEPNKPAYYFSDGHPPSYYDGNINLPVIFTNQPRYDPVNDMVWLTNDKIKIGINLKRGGQLAWASLINATTNLVYNGYDGGFQVTLDAYQKKDGYSQGGEVSGSGQPGMPTSYNVIQGGDFLNHAATLIDYHAIPNGYYVKMRPIHYPLSAKLSDTYIEATYTIIGRSVKIDYRYTSFRTDGQWDGAGFDGAGAPSCFIVNTLNKYKTYAGNTPWSFLPTQGGNLPIINMGQNTAEAHTTEHWGMVYDDQKPNSGIGVYSATSNTGNTTYFVFKQIEVYPGNGPGTEFNSGATFFQPFVDFSIPNRGNYVKDITSYLMIGSESEIRKEVYKFSGHEANIPVE